MNTMTLVSVDEYLHTTYRPDCDYVDGAVLKRNVGEVPHGFLQRFFLQLFLKNQGVWQLEPLPETRVQVSEKRFRIPDITLLPMNFTDERIIRSVPVLCVEIFSSEDRMKRMQERVFDYKNMGVPAVWAVDPWRRVLYMADKDGRLTVEEEALTISGTPVRVTSEEVFIELDRFAERLRASQA